MNAGPLDMQVQRVYIYINTFMKSNRLGAIRVEISNAGTGVVVEDVDIFVMEFGVYGGV